MKKKTAIVLIILLLTTSLWGIQKKLDQYKTVEVESLLYLPSGEYLQPLSLGYQLVLADMLWVKTITYFGSHFMGDGEYPWLYHILSLIIDLDPRYDFPYYFGGVVLSLEAAQAENANKILARGIEAYPDKWEYPFYIGFNHYYHRGDAAAAVPYIEKAAKLPGAPEFVQSLVGTLYMKSGADEIALKFFRDAYRNTNDEMIKKKIEIKIKEILSRKDQHDSSN